MKRVLIIEDDIEIVHLLEIHLKDLNCEVVSSQRGDEGFVNALEKDFSLIILDIMLPGMDGIEICQKLRAKNIETPIIMLTSKSEEIDKVLGLEIGADDYITKPFSVRELLARIKAVLRRSENITTDKIIKIGDDIKIFADNYEVQLQGKKIDLTNTEFNLLKILAAEKGNVLSRKKILKKLWGNDKIVTSRTVDVHIRNLREKLKNQAHLIKNVRGVGYKISE